MQSANHGPTNVLLVEDNDAHADLVTRVLSEHPARSRIFRVRNGEEALDYLFHRGTWAPAGSSPDPGLIILDLRLPRTNGLELLKEITGRNSLRRIPTVVLTSSEAEEDIIRAYDCNANAYLVKPLDFDALTEMLGSLATFWLRWNRSAAGDN